MDIGNLKERFDEVFGYHDNEIRTFFAPGRVNLIGEHTDYNGGYVFPCALNFGTYAAARKREDNTVRFASLNFDLKVNISLDNIQFKEAHDWANYPKGIIKEFMDKGFNIGGFEVLYYGNIPNGAGLSSSASIELATSVMLKGLFNCSIDMVDMVRLSQRAENSFIGVNCGIMDQFASGMGLRGYGMFLNCSTMEYQYVPIALDGYRIIIANTNKRRGLADSKYNERRSQCEKALEYLNKELKINHLGELDADTFEKYRHLIEDEVCNKRAEHIVYEDERVLKAVDSLQIWDLHNFGKLMNESHVSLRDLYEVTGVELDTLVEEAWKIDGCIGSRMTGAGFGGCTVSIVENRTVDEFIDRVGKNYGQRTGLRADFYIAETGDGAGEIYNTNEVTYDGEY